MIRVSKPSEPLNLTIQLPASKSESNRLLILQALAHQDIAIKNLSDADDTEILAGLLSLIEANPEDRIELNVGHAGTTFRFLTSYLATRNGRGFILTGSDRMLQRPCGELVKALRSLGADISYLGEDGFPPLMINGTVLAGGTVEMRGDVSSQFISSLLLTAPVFEKGLTINFSSELVSRPYLEMTIKLMDRFGAQISMTNSDVALNSGNYAGGSYTIESDWSAASYWYQMVALHGGTVELPGLRNDSLQADSALNDIYQEFGVHTEWLEAGVRITKQGEAVSTFQYDFTDCPDIAQTIACTCAGLGVGARLYGLKTLRIKETDRIAALVKELSKFGVQCEETEDTLSVHPGQLNAPSAPIETYHDHRMAMAFAPLCGQTDLSIEDPEVVSKSYPGFWSDMEKAGFRLIQERV